MYKVITLLKRHPGMAVEAFQRYWREQHAKMAVQTPKLRRYVQSHALPQGYSKGELIYDGISEMWFDKKEDCLPSLDQPFSRCLAEDLAVFTDPAVCVVMPVEIEVIVDGQVPADGVKNIEFVNCRPGMDLQVFRAYWKNHHGPLAAGIDVIRRYEQNYLCVEEYEMAEPPRHDGLAITWFDSTVEMKRGAASEVYALTRADEANFLPDGHLPFIVSREHTIC